MSIPYYVLLPLFVGFFAQFTKFLIHTFTKDFKLSYLNSYGGFPSAHTAFMTSVTTLAFLVEGMDSMLFSLAVVITAITVRDALGIRVLVSQHGFILNRIIKDARTKGALAEEYPLLNERLGHKIGEVLGGAVVGIGLTVLIYFVIVT
jgi:uncharacterized protein